MAKICSCQPTSFKFKLKMEMFRLQNHQPQADQINYMINDEEIDYIIHKKAYTICYVFTPVFLSDSLWPK